MIYREHLDAAWAAHLAPRSADAPTVISTFAGAGGSSLGFSMAGFRELLAVEWDDHAAEVFRENFAHVDLFHGDIGALSVDEVFERTGLSEGELDVFDGSPPCQGFSIAGRRKFDDPRNQLFVEYVRLLRGLRPRAFVMENVGGMVKGKMRLIFAEILRELKGCGYRVSARLLDSSYFGVPQSRPRMIFIGVRDDLGVEPSHPAGRGRVVTLRYAISDVRNTPEDLAESRYGENTICHKLLLLMKPGEAGSKYHPRGSMYTHYRLRWDRPSRTVLRQDGGTSACQCCHPEEPRRLTIPEIRRVGSFPDAFVFTGAPTMQWARIGNSVPPLMMRAIATHLRTEVLAA